MKTIKTLCATLLVFAIGAKAQEAANLNYTTSAPFELVLLSHDVKYNGTSLVACHEGAAIEALCAFGSTNVTASNSNVFYFNTTTPDNYPNYTTISQPGLLWWNLPSRSIDGLQNYTSPAYLNFDPTSNVAGVLLNVGFTQVNVNFAFTPDNHLAIPSFNSTEPVALERWYVCTTDYGYEYQTITWLLGTGQPDNPTCCPVQIVRVFL